MTIYHTITPDATYTFLTKDSFEESKIEAHPEAEAGFVYATSEVSDEEYARLTSWHLEGDRENEDEYKPTLGDA
jgi:hypothetical protein